MALAHETNVLGVSCDSCLKGNFRGKRYKCLICYDYDLCATCYEAGATTTRHTTEHPMQCILTRSDFDMYYGGEALSVEQPQAFTCPFCGKMGYTEVTLQEHVTGDHSDTSFEVVCPVCAALPGGDPNLVTDDFAAHLTLEHRSPRDLISFVISWSYYDEPSGSRHVRRIPHPGRGVGGTRARRANMHFSSSGGLASLSPNTRESMDPIAELLSQLSGVRRSATASQSSTSTQLQQLQMQLQLERQQLSTDHLNGQAQAARQQLERLPRRQTQTAANAQGPMSSAAAAAAAAASAQPGFIFDMTAGLSNSEFLLSRCTEPNLSESELQAIEMERADRSLFVQELLLNTLAGNLSLDLESESLEWQSPHRAGSQDTNNSPRASPPSAKDVDSSSASSAASGGGTGNTNTSGDASGTSTNVTPPHSQAQQLSTNVGSAKKVHSNNTSTTSNSTKLVRVSPLPPSSAHVNPPVASPSGNVRSSFNSVPRVVGRGTGTIREVSFHVQGGGNAGAPGRVPPSRSSSRENNASPSSTRRKLHRPLDGRNQSNEPPPPH
uniref:RING-type E3 ubiquitin transferase n=1 Tax=Strigamia maritima TaxID=126957 RepID=T1JLN5_STRMM